MSATRADPSAPSADPRHDLDLASYGLVAVLEKGHGTRHPDMAWEPKRLFDSLTARHAARPTR